MSAPAEASAKLLLVADPTNADLGQRLRSELSRFGVDASVETPSAAGPDLADELRASLGPAGAVAVAVGSAGPTAALRVAAGLGAGTAPSGPVFLVLFPGADERPARSLAASFADVIDLRAGLDDEDTIIHLAKRVATIAPDAATTDLSAAFAALGLRGAEGLARAEALRAAAKAPQLHMEHLLGGLYAIPDGPAFGAVSTARVSEKEFYEILVRAAKGSFPSPAAATADLPDPPDPSSLSRHARQAVLAAAGIAQRAGTPIRSRHLMAGALSVEGCDPVGELLQRGVSAQVALDWQGSIGAQATARADVPADRDLIGYGKIVDALVELLNQESTTFPLTIAISAPWGGGKSSVMRMMREQLEAPEHGPSWVTVYFPAWRYESGEQLWAAMAKATYDAALSGKSWMDRQRFRVALELRRGSLLRGLLRIGGVALSAVIGAVLGILATSAAGVSTEAGAAVGGTGGLLAVGQAVWRSVSDPFKQAMESYAAKPAVEAGDGFTSDAARHVDALMDMLLERDHNVAIFIDDLDRCTPRNLVRVVEAVNQIFVAGSALAEPSGPPAAARPPEPRRLAFVMGMDRHVVARGIEAEYSRLIARLTRERDPARLDYGLSFLDKIIQLWVTLPAPADLSPLLRRVAGRGASGDVADESTVGAKLQEMSARADGGTATREELIAVARDVEAHTSPEAAGAAQAARERFLAAAPALSEPAWEAMRAALRHLESNPRQVKRFNNAYRLQLNVASRSPDVSFSPAELMTIAKWVAIRLRWSALARAMDDEPELLQVLEKVAGKKALTTVDKALTEREKKWFEDGAVPDRPELLEALQVQAGEIPMSQLPFAAFLPIA